jgi:hypothetical protein
MENGDWGLGIVPNPHETFYYQNNNKNYIN